VDRISFLDIRTPEEVALFPVAPLAEPAHPPGHVGRHIDLEGIHHIGLAVDRDLEDLGFPAHELHIPLPPLEPDVLHLEKDTSRSHPREPERTFLIGMGGEISVRKPESDHRSDDRLRGLCIADAAAQTGTKVLGEGDVSREKGKMEKQ
jgi:hypothetical protein